MPRGLKYDTIKGDALEPLVDPVKEAQKRQRDFLQKELESSRGANALLQGRAKEVFQSGRRDLLTDEGRRLRETATGASSIGVADSPLAQRMARAERETTSEALTKFRSAVSVEQLSEAYKSEQAAIQRLFEAGETELAYYRQVNLTQMQIDAAQRIAKMQSRSQILGGLFSAIGNLVTLGIGSKLGWFGANRQQSSVV